MVVVGITMKKVKLFSILLMGLVLLSTVACSREYLVPICVKDSPHAQVHITVNPNVDKAVDVNTEADISALPSL